LIHFYKRVLHGVDHIDKTALLGTLVDFPPIAAIWKIAV